MTAIITLLTLLLCGMGLFVAGVYLMFGLPAGLLAGSVACLLLAFFLHVGMVKVEANE